MSNHQNLQSPPPQQPIHPKRECRGCSGAHWMQLAIALTFLPASPFVAAQQQLPPSAQPSGNEITANATPASISLGFDAYLRKVLAHNSEIAYHKLDWGIAASAVEGARAEFEAGLNLTAGFDSNDRLLPTGEEQSLFGTQTGTLRRNKTDITTAEASISKKISTGARINLVTSLNRLNDPSQLAEWRDKEYKTFAGISVTQPLLKGSGFQANEAATKVAEAERLISYQNYRKKISDILRDASNAYWDLYLAQERENLRKNALQVAKQTLADLQQRLALGKSSQSDVTEGRIMLAERQAALFDAEQERVAAMRQARVFLTTSDLGPDTQIIATDSVKTTEVHIDTNNAIRRAMEMRPDYQAQVAAVAKEDLRLAYAENQRYPQLDLKLTYGYNGLDKTPALSAKQIESDRLPHWSVAVEFNIPLGDGLKTRSEFAASHMRKRQALELLKAAEVEVANAVQGASQRVGIHFNRVQAMRQFVAGAEQLHTGEQTRMKEGRSSVRDVFERENEVIRARIGLMDAEVRHTQAVTSFIAAEGRLLQQYGVEDSGEKFDLTEHLPRPIPVVSQDTL